METMPLRETVPDFTAEAEAEQASRLQDMLRSYHQAEADEDTPQAADAKPASAHEPELIPYNVNKVRLTGAEGSMALAKISRRLADPRIPQSRREYHPVCAIRTYVKGSLVAGESRSLRPVGKHHYLLKQVLQAGKTTITIAGHSWTVLLPDDQPTQDYLITLYKPPGMAPQFHVFPVAGLMAAGNLSIPDWVKDELGVAAPG